jgi:hypothetical protein
MSWWAWVLVGFAAGYVVSRIQEAIAFLRFWYH